MNLSARRRGLMGKKAEQTIPISFLAAGDRISIKENGTYRTYIYLGEAYGNAIVLRELTSGSRKQYNASQGTFPVDYEGNYVDTYLTGTFLSRYGSEITNNLNPSEIEFITYINSVAGTNTISRSIFLLSAYELGLGGSETGVSFLGALKTAMNTSTANTARICKDSSNNAVTWWTRTAYTVKVNRYVTIVESGASDFAQQTTAGIYVRPALSLKKTTPVKQTADGFAI